MDIRNLVMNLKAIASISALLLPCSLSAQFVAPALETHISAMELGIEGGLSLSPDLIDYLNLFHGDYAFNIHKTGKLLLRQGMLADLAAEEEYAEALDSALAERRRIEELNLLDNTADVAVSLERTKIDEALSSLKSNISLILTVDSTAVELRSQWLDIENMLLFGYRQILRSVLPNSERHKQYLEIESDIRQHNDELVALLNVMRTKKKLSSSSASSVQRPSATAIARSSLTDWTSRFSSSYSAGN